MTASPLLVRRANLDDLPALKALWTTTGLPVNELENRITEFQIVEHSGCFAGAVGVQIMRQHLRFYAEDFTDFSVADAARERFWDRIQKLAANHGVFRVWTQETSPFWRHWGFQPATPEILERLPEGWKAIEGGWLTLELKSEDAIKAALGEQFAGMMQVEKNQTDAVAAKAKTFRTILTVFFFVIAAVCFAIACYLLAHRPLTVR